MLTRTISTEDPLYKNSNAYFWGAETEYRMTSKFSLNFAAYGEDRNGNLWVTQRESADTTTSSSTSHLEPRYQRWQVYSLNPGISFHADWNSIDRIQLYYSRRFYSSAADSNSAQPLDHHVIALGGYVTF
jgi:hypothetical protein